MCVPLYIDGVELVRPNNECWCPLFGEGTLDAPVDLYRTEARLDLVKHILDALAEATKEAMKPENAEKSQDGRIVELTLRMERW